jgi:hypothetical protein
MRGSTLIEYLLALLIGSLTIAGVMQGVRSTKQVDTLVERTERRITTRAVLRSVIAQIIRATDTSALPFTPKIHRDGVTFYSGERHPFERSALRSSLASDAISWIEPNPRATLRVRSSLGGVFEACPTNDPDLSLAGVSLMVGVTTDELTLLEVRSARRLADRCRALELSPVRSLQFPRVEPDFAAGLVLLIPVLRENLLYIDQHQTLRWASVVGDALVENQPVLNDLPALSFKLHPAAGYGTFQLELTIPYPDQSADTLLGFDQFGTITLQRLLFEY